jgi:2-alkenal reductase
MNTRYLMITCALTGAMLLTGCAGAAESATLAPAISVPVAANPAPAQSFGPQVSAGSLAALETTFEDIYTKVNPSVVNIQVVQNTNPASLPFSQGLPFGFGFSNPNQSLQRRALGSGFVWDAQGHIVTNNHVIDSADQITVTFSDGTTVDAKLVGADPRSDLAVIQVDLPAAQLHPVTVGDSNQVKVGQLAVAIGNPYGLSGTMTQGIVSALSRSLPVDSSTSSLQQQGGTYEIPDIIQTDAAINPGNSGGVLVDAQGSVIGVTAAIQSPVDANSGIGFVIPSSIVERVVPALIQNGRYDHPYIGITGTSLTYDLAKAMSLDPSQKGAVVIDVVPNGPADKAGIHGSTSQVSINGSQVPVGGDVIIAIEGNAVTNFEDVSSYLINNTQVGQTVSLTILRQGSERTVQLTLGSLPQQTGQ